MFIHRYKPPYKNYYVAAFPMQPTEKQDEMRIWCYQTFGNPGYKAHTPDIRWVDDIGSGEIRFNRESDLAMFLLRWE